MILTPETKLTFKSVKAFEEKSTTKIFLAGSIENGKARNWQPVLAQNLQNKFGDNVIIFNPRREGWDPNAGEELIREQIDWELNAQEISDIIVFYFDENTTSPITLLELGLAINSNKKILVWCPEAYYRYTNVFETLKYHNMENLLITEKFEGNIIDAVIHLKNNKKVEPLPMPDYRDMWKYNPNPLKTLLPNICYKCGINLENSMGYVCGASDCPVFIKAT